MYRRGERWRRSPRRAWLVIRTPDNDVVQFDGPVLELVTDGRGRLDRRLAALGPDVLAEAFDEGEYLRRLRAADPARPIAEALLDQRTIAGIGNIWKSEACHLAGVDPWRAAGGVSDEEALRLVWGIRPLMRLSSERGRVVTHRPERPLRGGGRRTLVYGRAGRPCRACGALVRSRGQGDDNRTTYWCPACQR